MPTHSGFEPGRNDYQRLEGRWPASTGWLIVSILFANKLWIMDVTSMSLYWVARLPIERPKPTSPLRPKEQTSRASPSLRELRALRKVAPAGRRRHWKIALSLAIVGSFAGPFFFRTLLRILIDERHVTLNAAGTAAGIAGAFVTIFALVYLISQFWSAPSRF